MVRAILIHFMIGYEHPFVDGNARTARALFYWMMAKSGYWLTEFLSISTIIRKAPIQYARAYLFSENDDNDVTYFLDYNLRVILRSIRNLHSYLARKAQEMRNVQQMLDGSALAALLNYRQIALLVSMRKHPDLVYTIDSHRRSHKVTYQTARTDLLGLADLGARDLRQARQSIHLQPGPGFRRPFARARGAERRSAPARDLNSAMSSGTSAPSRPRSLRLLRGPRPLARRGGSGRGRCGCAGCGD